MVSVTPTARNIEITAEGLQEDLARLKIQKQALERELAAVTAHLDSVSRALVALQALMPESAPASAAARPAGDVAGVPATAAPTPVPAADKAEDGADEGTRGEDVQGPGTGDTDGAKAYGKLTEQILAYFAEAGNTDVRARDVASALGRDTDSGSINAVRSTLDRLVGQSRVRRVGRGLYRAAKR